MSHSWGLCSSRYLQPLKIHEEWHVTYHTTRHTLRRHSITRTRVATFTLMVRSIYRIAGTLSR